MPFGNFLNKYDQCDDIEVDTVSFPYFNQPTTVIIIIIIKTEFKEKRKLLGEALVRFSIQLGRIYFDEIDNREKKREKKK